MNIICKLVSIFFLLLIFNFGSLTTEVTIFMHKICKRAIVMYIKKVSPTVILYLVESEQNVFDSFYFLSYKNHF